MKESKKRATKNYIKKCKSYVIRLNPNVENDKKIIDYLESKLNKTEAIRESILNFLEARDKELSIDLTPLFKRLNESNEN